MSFVKGRISTLESVIYDFWPRLVGSEIWGHSQVFIN
jgi:hypothetical protein